MKNLNIKPRCYSYIRFSTPDQAKGDSLRRQIEKTRLYVEEKGLTLDESLNLKDEGVSAFRGDNINKGALGVFLSYVKCRKIPKGSILIIESLDRLTRAKISDALNLFLELLRSGIKIVTLQDNMEYSEDTISDSYIPLMMSLMIMSRANEESQVKSMRVRAAWENKRANIHSKKLTSRCPAWLKLTKDKKQFEEISLRVKLVNRIFKMSYEGKGIETIAKQLNQEVIESWGPKAKGWHSSYIFKILKNRSVIGEFQPHTKIDGKRVPEGSPIKDYFPRIVPESLFHRVQERLSAMPSKAGRTGKVRNLFGGLAVCAYCGAPMQFIDKGIPPKGGRYLVCDNARRGRGCRYISFKYQEFEEAVLAFCKGLDLSALLSKGEKDKELTIATLQEQIGGTCAKLEEIRKIKENLGNALTGEEDIKLQKFIKSKLQNTLDEEERLFLSKVETEKAINCLVHSHENIASQTKSLKRIIEIFSSGESEEVIDLRLKLRSELRNLVKCIKVSPIGRVLTQNAYAIWDQMEEGWIKTWKREGKTEIEISELKKEFASRKLENAKKDKRIRDIEIILRNDEKRLLVPTKENPSKFHVVVDITKDSNWSLFGEQLKERKNKEEKEIEELLQAVND